MNYDAANAFLKRRLNMPTSLKSLGISSEVPAAVRAHCFFSARVAEAHVLEKLRDVSDRYSRGEVGLAMARGELKTFLAGQGHDPDAKGMSALASTARLNLILRQNAAMANAVGQYQVGRDPDIEARWPNWRYIAMSGARDSHAAWNGRVFRKSDPIWQRIFPPWEFNCRCQVEDCDDEEAKQYGGVIQGMPMPDVPASGFQFNPAEAFTQHDMSRLADPIDRREVMRKIRVLSKSEKIDFTATPSTTPLAVDPVAGMPERSRIDAWVREQVLAGDERRKPENVELPLGIWNPTLSEAIGMEPGATVNLSRKTGISHTAKRHDDQLRGGKLAEALCETLGSADVQVSYTIRSGQQDLINVRSLKTDAICTLRRVGNSEEWEVLSAHKLGDTANATLYRERTQRVGP